MTDYDLVVRARRVVVDGSEQQAAVAVRDGEIVRIATGSEARDIGLAGDHTVELGDDVVVLPGLVDLGMSTSQSGAEPAEAFARLTRAAAAGGVTTVVDMPGPAEFTDPGGPDGFAAFERRREDAGGQLAVDCGFWAPATAAGTGSLHRWVDAGALGFVAARRWSSGGPPEPLDAGVLSDVMAEVADLDRILLVRPDASDEVGGTERILAAAAETGCRTHLFHISDGAALDAIAGAKSDGRAVTASTCPQYLTITSEQLAWMDPDTRPAGSTRDAVNLERLWQGLADGTLDAIASRTGVSSVRYTASVVWTGARMRGLGVDRVSEWLGSAPARIAGLDDRGLLREGQQGDLTILATEDAYVVTGYEPGSTTFGRPYCLERPLVGGNRGTYTRGTTVEKTMLAGRPVGG